MLSREKQLEKEDKNPTPIPYSYLNSDIDGN
jgi:hypothetical protein